MPEVATDETVTRRRTQRAAASGQSEESVPLEETAINEVELRSQTARPEAPIVRVKCVYLGSHPHRSVSLPGRIMSEEMPGPGGQKRTVKTAAKSGNTPYDFFLVDSAGDPDPRVMPDDHPIKIVRGKRFEWLEHPDHAYALANMKDAQKQTEFKLVGDRMSMQILEEYFLRKSRAKREKKRDYEEITS